MKNKLYVWMLAVAMTSILNVSAQKSATIKLDVNKAKYKINRNVYGHFTEHLGHCIYEGIYVDGNNDIPNVDGMRIDVLEALKNIEVPLLRWPGGCFADEYHWKDGIGPKAERPSIINTNWGGVTENNSFGTHEFMRLCELLDCEAYISGNMGSGTVQEMSQWVEYLNSDNVSPMTELRKQNGRDKSWGVKYWGIGNEMWGCGGRMTPEYYVNEAKRYSHFCRDYGKNRLFRLASGPNEADYHWTELVMRDMGFMIDGIGLHYYVWGEGETAVNFDEKHWFTSMRKALHMNELIEKHSAIMDKYDPYKRVTLAVDEWGTWFASDPGTNPGFLRQQSTLRDALVAGTTLNIFNNHADRVRMANIAQAINVLQAVILTDGPQMVLTPTYYVFDMYKVHQNALMTPVEVLSPKYSYKGSDIDAVNASASIDEDGSLNITICNMSPIDACKTTVDITGYNARKLVGEIITADDMTTHNTFNEPENIELLSFKDFKLKGNEVIVNLPPMSLVKVKVQGEAELKESVDVKNLKKGLAYKYYEGSWERLPDFSVLTPVRSGIIGNVKYPEKHADDYFGLEFDGYFYAEESGLYEFYLASDDGTRMYINNEVLIDNDNLHGEVEIPGTAFLSKGYHKMKVIFFEGNRGDMLRLKYKAPGGEKTSVPVDLFFHR